MAEFLEGIEGYDEVDISVGNKPKEIVPGAYVLKIMSAKLERYSAESVAIKLAFDVDEGEYKGYYGKLYEYNKSGQYAANAKWKGTLSLFYPTSSDPDKKKREIANFKRAITAINDSNKTKIDPTKKLNLDSFKGKYVGGAFGLVDWEWDGKSGTKCECRWFVGVDRVRAGEVETPAHKGVKGAAPIANTNTAEQQKPADEQPGTIENDFEEIISDGEIPF